MSALADAVLPLIRTRADLSRFSAANNHGHQMHDAVVMLRAAAETEDPVVVFAVTEKAIASALKVIMRRRLRRDHQQRSDAPERERLARIHRPGSVMVGFDLAGHGFGVGMVVSPLSAFPLVSPVRLFQRVCVFRPPGVVRLPR